MKGTIVEVCISETPYTRDTGGGLLAVLDMQADSTETTTHV